MEKTSYPGSSENCQFINGGGTFAAHRGLMETLETTTATKEVIRRAIEHLQRKIRVHQVILFGSHARGEANEWGDIDLAVVSPDFVQMNQKQVMDLLVEVALTVNPSLEIRPYTPQDLKDARPTNFLGHILAEGKAVYKDGKFLSIEGQSALP